ncbi:hypothetical protein NPX13_g1094 [Xylaria arbuscula]|uniref:RBR-type E3 ubiquitin transferase n=1 Tax=Xylaria arbuscula TaxID=114810 RepID=A0A9W8NLN6_9PEZI|nr:hypothetical protein NPX13_g1094 [Xylaria arbuscula]
MDMSAFAHLKDEDIAVIIQLLQEDGEEIMSAATRKGKQPEGTMTDTQVAFNSFMEELRAADTFLADRRMTRSIQSAIQLDGDALLQSQNEERIAEQDRNLSVSLSKGEREPPAPQSTSLPLAQDEEILEKMALVASQPESSAWAASRQVGTARQKRSCEACGEQKHFAALSRAPCQHEYCRECLSQLFRNAIVDESLFPPRCCKQPIPLDKSQLFLDSNVVVQFRRKAVEFSTPNRTYCHNTSCAAFIPASNYSYTTATCNDCHEQTCNTCKSASHEGDCPNDQQLQQVIQLAREQGWQRCQNCWGMVELNTGCHHMTTVADAVSNFVMFVVHAGRVVVAITGWSTDSTSARLKLMLVIMSEKRRNAIGKPAFKRSQETCARTMSAIMSIGTAEQGLKNAKNVMM